MQKPPGWQVVPVGQQTGKLPLLQQVVPAGQQVVVVPNVPWVLHTWVVAQHVLPLMHT
jgi:hypothetical protein